MINHPFRCWTIIKWALATLGLVGLLITIGSNGELDAESQFYLRLRPRLGHLPGVDGYLGIFEDYFNSVIKLNDKTLANIDINDWRNVRPTGELCVDFLQSFQIKRHKLAKPHAIVALDACLGWLFDESDEKEADINRFTVATRLEVEKLAKDKKLATIYQSTAFKDDKVPKKTKEDLHAYISKLLKIYTDNPRSGCHGLWLETYTDFIEDVYLGDCDSDEDCVYYGYEDAKKDSYLNLVADSTRQSSKICYGVMQKQAKKIMAEAYEAEMAFSAKLNKRIKAATTRVDKQSEAMMWGKDMTRILQLVSGTDPDAPINLAQVVKDLNKLRINDEDTVERFTEAIGKYAIQNVNLKDSAKDPEGRARFGGSTLWQDPNEKKKPFEFYNIVYGLIRLTNHESIYGISKDKFEEDVLKNKWESLYLTTFACQLISITWGELNYDTNVETYLVSFRQNDGEDLIEDWPLHVMLSKVVEDTAKDFEQLPQEQSQPLQQQQPQQQQQQQQQQQEEPAAVQQPEAVAKQQKQPNEAPAAEREHKSHFPSFKFKLFKRKTQQQPEQGQLKQKSETIQVAQSSPEPPKQNPEPLKPTSNPTPKVPSLASIEMFRDLKGYYPELPPNIHEIYPSLPKNLDGVYPKKLGLHKPKPAAAPATAPAHRFQHEPEPVQFNRPRQAEFGAYNNPYGSNMGFGTNSGSSGNLFGDSFNGYQNSLSGQTMMSQESAQRATTKKMNFVF